MKKQDENLTKIWKRYQKCKDYLDKKYANNPYYKK